MRRDEQWARALFYRTFQGPDLWASSALWQAYQQWRGRQEMEQQQAFKGHLQAQFQKAKNAIEALPGQLINGQKGKWYELNFRLPACVGKCIFRNLEKAGLNASFISPSLCRISGIPLETGEYSIMLIYGASNWRRGMPVGIREFKLLINPDPQELWQDLPCAPDLEYPRPNWDFEERQCHGARLLAASLRGRAHAHAALPRDDAFGLGCARGWQILAVADGAGSAPFSRKGAELACQKAIAVCSWQLANCADLDLLLDGEAAMTSQPEWLAKAKKLAWGILPQAALEAHKAIRQEAQLNEREPKQYATTLLLAAARKCSAGWAALSFQVGDGAMAALSTAGAKLLAEPDEGDFAGQTRFLTMPEIFEQEAVSKRLGVHILPDFQGLLLFTDGVTDPRFGARADLSRADLWQKLWRELKAKSSGESREDDFKDWLGFWSRGNHDDRTLAILLTDD